VPGVAPIFGQRLFDDVVRDGEVASDVAHLRLGHRTTLLVLDLDGAGKNPSYGLLVERNWWTTHPKSPANVTL
jgi:hypothetical protein